MSAALLSAASARPGTVVQLAERACVGYDVARFKASALVRSGALVALTVERPRVLAAAGVAHQVGVAGGFGKAAAWFDVLALAPDMEGCGMT